MLRRSSSWSQSFVASDVNCTKCIGVSLFIWLVLALIFLFHNIGTPNPPDGSSPKQSSNAHAQPSSSSSSITASYAESISSELTENGWKPVELHQTRMRMPVEQMEFLINKYWIPRMPQPTANQAIEDEGAGVGAKHRTVDNLDLASLSERKIRHSQSRTKIIDNVDVDDAARVTTSTLHNVSRAYPAKWTSLCYPERMHDQECILTSMQYWSKGVAVGKQRKRPQPTGYVTFLEDCGGWNNIRQGFEFHAMVAWLTDRTLVLPPDIAWYLIDNGPITRGQNARHEANAPAWPDQKQRPKGVSNFDIWFDLDDLSVAISVITTPEFIRRESDSLSMPTEFRGGDAVNADQDTAEAYKKWLNDKARELNVNLPWGQLTNYIAWPSLKQVEENNRDTIDEAWIDGRKPRQYTPFLRAANFIHFPSCLHDDEDENYRYLGQIARSIAFDSRAQDLEFKQVLRDHIHLKREIMQYAAMVIEVLGAFNFAAFHIRRNELQYKYVFAEAEVSFGNVRPLLSANEAIYIATDEKDENYFKAFEEHGKRKVYRWRDFFGAQAQFEQTKNVKIPGKLHGEIEMVICAMGRIFFGTKESTFSQYIGVLRGYLNAPYTQTLYHHYQLTADVDESSVISKSNPDKPYRGQTYKIAFPDLWEAIKDLP